MAALNLAEAEQILVAAKAKVQSMGAKMSVSVVDPRGDLIAMFRTDGASLADPSHFPGQGGRRLLFRASQRRAYRKRPGAGVPRADGHGRRAHDPRPGCAPGISRRGIGRRGRRQRRHRPGGRRRLNGRHPGPGSRHVSLKNLAKAAFPQRNAAILTARPISGPIVAEVCGEPGSLNPISLNLVPWRTSYGALYYQTRGHGHPRRGHVGTLPGHCGRLPYYGTGGQRDRRRRRNVLLSERAGARQQRHRR